MKKHIAILTQLAPFRRHLENYPSTMQRGRSAYTTWKNTIISHRLILKYPKAYEAHLERIADFHACGEGIWWRHIVSGVEFLDGLNERKYNNNGPPLHHFRTHTLKSEDQYLKACWKESIAHLDSIPHHTVRIYD